MNSRAIFLVLFALTTGCTTWRGLRGSPPDDATPQGLRIVPNENFPPPPPAVPTEGTLSGDMLYVARLVLLDRWPPEQMPSDETDYLSRCGMSPENYRLDIRDERTKYVVEVTFVQQWRCGFFTDTDATYEISKDKLQIISKTLHE